MLIQIGLIATILLSALVGLGWPDPLEPVARTVGAVLMALGLLLLVVAAHQLGSSLTPLPAPRAGQQLTTGGLYRHAPPDVRRRDPDRARLDDVLRQPGRARPDRDPRALRRAQGAPRGTVASRALPEYADYRQRTPRKFIPLVY